MDQNCRVTVRAAPGRNTKQTSQTKQEELWDSVGRMGKLRRMGSQKCSVGDSGLVQVEQMAEFEGGLCQFYVQAEQWIRVTKSAILSAFI